MKEFTSPAREDVPGIKFSLDGEDYEFHPPKHTVFAYTVMRVPTDQPDYEMKYVAALFDWLDLGLGEEQATRIDSRLRDPDDPLEVETVTKATQWLMKESTGRPTTPSARSSAPRGRPGRTSTAGVSEKGSTSDD